MGQILIITIVKCILLLKVYAKYIKATGYESWRLRLGINGLGIILLMVLL